MVQPFHHRSVCQSVSRSIRRSFQHCLIVSRTVACFVDTRCCGCLCGDGSPYFPEKEFKGWFVCCALACCSMSVDNLQIIAAETAVYICYVSSIHTSHAQFRAIFRSFNPQLYIFLVLFPVNLWPIWKASLIATAATILWKFNVFWAMALPLTSVTGTAGVHVFNDDK